MSLFKQKSDIKILYEETKERLAILEDENNIIKDRDSRINEVQNFLIRIQQLLLKEIESNKTETIKSYHKGQKVIYIPENKVYDFGYEGQTGKAILYEEGERNMQDSIAVDFKKIKPVK